jgi:hypothetical protein
VPALRTALFVTAFAAGLWAQSADKPLTNREIESMLAAGLPESTIIIKIEIAVDRGFVNLDASSAALAELAQRGATEPELNAVLWAEPVGAVWKQEQEETRAVPGLPDRVGVYFKAQSGWAGLSPLMLWTPFLAAQSWYDGRRESSVVLGAAHSQLQIREPQPTFYLRQPVSGDPWQIVRVGARNDQRLLRVSSHGDFGRTVQTQPAQVRDVQMTRVAGEIFTLRPTAPLDAGEYILCTTVPGGPSLNLCYSFGIQR